MTQLDNAASNTASRKRIALVIANPASSTTTGWPVGFWWSELTHPWLVFTEAGYDVVLFSPEGGRCEGDAMSDPDDPSGYSRNDLISRGFLHTPDLKALIDATRPVADADVDAFDAIVVAGGQSPMFSFETATALHAKFAAFHAAGKVTAALCHGVAVLKYVRTADGEFIAKGKTVTGFANAEEDAADQAVWNYGLLPHGEHLMPWRIEDAMREIGAHYVRAEPWHSFAVRDGNLITGQQNFSGAETARLVVEALSR
ncbi:MAG: type 1 glutamine amidotransferase domain-containing protein [Lysobacteraceae bacterium]|nr:MAG: type 1 glutamine amidotransferase domain-containing protein [Xanthomonadaceae bacterium]